MGISNPCEKIHNLGMTIEVTPDTTAGDKKTGTTAGDTTDTTAGDKDW